MTKSTYIIVYGRGGHQEQMSRLLDNGLFVDDDDIQILGFTDSNYPLTKKISKTYKFNEYRDKFSVLTTLIYLPFNSMKLILTTLLVIKKYKVQGVITTGPGVAILPCILFRLFGKKLVVFESWSKFKHPTITARILYKFAALFIIQNKSMNDIFPKAKYWGRL